MDESVAGSGGTASAVFLGEYASNMELLLFKLEAQGYNTVRVDFDPYCTDTIDYNYMSVYSATNAQRAIQIAQHYGFWIIITTTDTQTSSVILAAGSTTGSR